MKQRIVNACMEDDRIFYRHQKGELFAGLSGKYEDKEDKKKEKLDKLAIELELERDLGLVSAWMMKYNIDFEAVLSKVIYRCGDFLRLTQATGGLSVRTPHLGAEFTTTFSVPELLEQVKSRRQL